MALARAHALALVNQKNSKVKILRAQLPTILKSRGATHGGLHGRIYDSESDQPTNKLLPTHAATLMTLWSLRFELKAEKIFGNNLCHWYLRK